MKYVEIDGHKMHLFRVGDDAAEKCKACAYSRNNSVPDSDVCIWRQAGITREIRAFVNQTIG